MSQDLRRMLSWIVGRDFQSRMRFCHVWGQGEPKFETDSTVIGTGRFGRKGLFCKPLCLATRWYDQGQMEEEQGDKGELVKASEVRGKRQEVKARP